MRQEGLLLHAASRLLGLIPTLLLLITIAFFLIRLAPGGPFDSEKILPPEIKANLDAKYHLDEPLVKQYFRYLGQIITLDFGPSFQYKDWTVNELIARGFPVSLTIGGLAMVLAFLLGTLIGIVAAMRQNSAVDYSLMGVAMLGISIPNFVVAPLLILVVAVYAGWLPAGGWDWSVQRMVLPVITLALPVIAYIARLTRGSMIEVLNRACDQSRRSGAHEGNHGQQRRFERMPADDQVLRQTLGPGRANVIAVKHLDHTAAGQAGNVGNHR